MEEIRAKRKKKPKKTYQHTLNPKQKMKMKVVKEEILLSKLVVDEYCQKLGRPIHLCLLP